MSFFKVEEIIDENTIRVSPKWKFKGVEGDIVVVYGYKNPETEKDKERVSGILKNFLLGQFVELKGAFLLNPNNPITCHVFRNALDISRIINL